MVVFNNIEKSIVFVFYNLQKAQKAVIPDEGEAILFIGVNNPYFAASPGLDFCPSVCSTTSGITKDFNVVDKGPFQCCQVDQELRNKIPSLPNIADANSNWPKLITAMWALANVSIKRKAKTIQA